MSEIIEINNDADKIEVDDVDKIFTFDDERHNGKPITIIEISPNEKYLITYSEEDRSIVGWNVEDKVHLKFHQAVKTIEDNEEYKYEIKSLCVSDDNKLVYITIHRYRYSDYKYTTITVIDMNNKDKNIALDLNNESYQQKHYYCTFNLKNEFILYSEVNAVSGKHKIICIYSTQTKNNKWECKRFYEIPEDYELISISKYDKVYLFSNDHIYEWNINTERGVKIFGNNKDKNKFETKNIGIFSNDEKFISLKINDKIIVYLIELKIPIASLDINDDIQLYNFMNHTGLFLLPSLFYYKPDKEVKYCWNNKYEIMFNPTDEPPTDDQTKFVFGIRNGRVWKSKFDKKMKSNFSSENSDELNNKIVECDEYLNVLLSNLFIDTVSKLFQKVTTNVDYSNEKRIELAGNLIEWDIRVGDGKIKLEVFKKGKLISTKIENYHYPYKYYDDINNVHSLVASSLFNNDDIVILTTFGILIYTFSENNKSISLNYFYFMKLENYRYKNEESKYGIKKYKVYMKILQHYYKGIFSKSTLPSPNYDSFRLDGWVSVIINNKSSLLKYGVELLKFKI
ncbi:uncharacterized protein OCT59_027224 [Rhizophagus irregularis]|uniref:uncharacterized protein n=1 Tax=Rhizophagus irregularis TaxID=588596 RepID=UPI0033333420|nr:hypothetical protein OCT59_027224 [Rhizophagus irregularis]